LAEIRRSEQRSSPWAAAGIHENASATKIAIPLEVNFKIRSMCRCYQTANCSLLGVTSVLQLDPVLEEGLDLLRQQWCAEPSVHRRKATLVKE